MVKFTWTWADYERLVERERRAAARKAAKEQAAEPVDDSADPVDDSANPVVEVAPAPAEQQLRYCRACGKTVLERCAYAGCPLS